MEREFDSSADLARLLGAFVDELASDDPGFLIRLGATTIVAHGPRLRSDMTYRNRRQIPDLARQNSFIQVTPKRFSP